MNLQEELLSSDLNDLIDRLTLYATSRLKTRGLKDFQGREPIDFVSDLILKVLEGTRDFEKAKCSFREFMFGCLKSEISNFFTLNPPGKNLDLSGLDQSEIQNNNKELESQVIEMLKSSGADDDELILFDYWLEGTTKPAEIASDLGIDVKEVYVITKRLERRLQKIKSKAKEIL